AERLQLHAVKYPGHHQARARAGPPLAVESQRVYKTKKLGGKRIGKLRTAKITRCVAFSTLSVAKWKALGKSIEWAFCLFLFMRLLYFFVSDLIVSGRSKLGISLLAFFLGH